MDEKQLIARLLTTPPSCLEGFKVETGTFPEPFGEDPCSVWRISCRCEGSHGRFLGYELKEIALESGEREGFVSPLAFQCAACEEITELLDTDRHGYHAAVARLQNHSTGSCYHRGEGPRKAFLCPGCGGQSFAITVGFVYWNIDELAEYFDKAWEDLFSLFLCECRCEACGQISKPVALDDL